MAGGGESAFTRFHGAYFDPLYRYLLVRVRGDEDLARDVLQETMLRVIRYVKPFEKEGDLWNWVRRLAKTALVDEWRRRRARRGIANDTFPMREGNPDKDGYREEEGSAILLQHLESSLGLLDEGERRLVEGKYLEDKSVKELARETKCSPKAVESRLGRIRRKLKAFILERLKNAPA
jgi:RNA polymerase sigma-70 factor (ECF subfamily)